MAKPVVQLWLHAREAGWPLDGFCAKLEELGVATPLFGSPGSVHSGESLSDIQERFAVYSNLEPPESTISALQDAFNAPPDDSYCTSPLTGVLSSPTTLHLTSNNLPDDDITSPYRRMPDSVPEPYLANGRAPASFDAVVTGDAEGVATRAPASFWILIAAYLSVVVAGFVLTLLSADVYSDGIPNDMRILYPLVALFSFLMIGVFVRTQSSFCRRFYIPASVVGGVIACCFIQVMTAVFHDYPSGKRLVELIDDAWTAVPPLAINFVFGTMFLGQKVPKLNAAWKACAPQFVYGQLVAWGQYIVGLSIGSLFGYYVWAPKQKTFGLVLPIGFEGGQGTAAGLNDVFSAIGWENGTDYCILSATVGELVGLFLGIGMVNWHASGQKVPTIDLFSPASQQADPEQALPSPPAQEPQPADAEKHAGGGAEPPFDDPFSESREAVFLRKTRRELLQATFIPREHRVPSGVQVVQYTSIENLAYHFGVVCLTLGFAYGIKALLMTLDSWVSRSIGTSHVFATLPTFPGAMLGGMLVQVGLQQSGHVDKIDPVTLSHLSNFALDIIVVTSMATVRLQSIYKGAAPLAILLVFGTMWELLMFLVVTPRFFTNHAFERGLCELGQSTGVTATGLLLLRLVDPLNETPVQKSFALKQLLHEPFMGGGLWTTIAVPLVDKIGPIPVLGISVFFFTFWSLFYVFHLRPKMVTSATIESLTNRLSINR